jgi:hypothetical protein
MSTTDPSGVTYLACSTRLFEILSNASVDLEMATRVVSKSLTEMLSILNNNNIVSPPMAYYFTFIMILTRYHH